MVERSGALGRPRCVANSFIRLDLLEQPGWRGRMETPIGNDRRRARCAAFKTRNIRRISVGFREFRGGNRGKIWTSMEEARSSKEGCGESRKGDRADCLSIGRMKRCKIRLTEFSIWSVSAKKSSPTKPMVFNHLFLL